MTVATERGIDVSRVAHLEARRLMLNHFDSEPPENDALKTLREERRKIEREVAWPRVRALVAEIFGQIDAKIAALEAQESSKTTSRGEAFDVALADVGVEFTDFELHDDYCGVDRCGLTGLPLMCDDETVENANGDRILAAILPIPEATP